MQDTSLRFAANWMSSFFVNKMYYFTKKYLKFVVDKQFYDEYNGLIFEYTQNP